jgi:Leucine-rich repeat (LRR) protein
MFLSKISSLADAQAWNYQVRESYQSKSDYIYIKRPCSWLSRINDLVWGVLMLLGSALGYEYRWAAKEFFLQAYYGYSVDIASLGKELFPYELFKSSIGGDLEVDRLFDFFKTSREVSLQLMSLLGSGLHQECPLLESYLTSMASTPGERLELFLRLTQALSFNGRVSVAPNDIEHFLLSFEDLRESLSNSGWQLSSLDEAGTVLESISSRAFKREINLFEQIRSYKQLMYMQGDLQLNLCQCKEIPHLFKDLRGLKTVIISQSSAWPKGIGSLIFLKQLSLVDCQIEATQESLLGCSDLTVVDIKGHQASKVPKEICQHSTLLVLRVQGSIKEIESLGSSVETLVLQPSLPGLKIPNLADHANLSYVSWPGILRSELKVNKLPPSCVIRYL